MNSKENGDDSSRPKATPSTGIEPKHDTTESPKANSEDANLPAPTAIKNEKPEGVEAPKQKDDAHGSPTPSVNDRPRTDEAASFVTAKSVTVKKPQSFFAERPLPPIETAPRVLRHQSRRDFLVFGTGALAARWHLRIRCTHNDSVSCQAAELLPQHFLSDVGYRPFQIGKAHHLAS
jgi:hypothetical protein